MQVPIQIRAWLSVLTLAAVGCSERPVALAAGRAARSGSVTVAEPVGLDLGVLRESEIAQAHTVEVVNRGASTWQVTRFVPSCACVQVLSGERTVAPGATLHLRFRLDLRSLRGELRQDVKAVLTDGGVVPLLELVAVVIPEPYVQPETLEPSQWLRGSASLVLALPWAEAEWSVQQAPAELEITETRREAWHGATRLELAVARAAGAGTQESGDARRILLHVHGATQGSAGAREEKVLEVLLLGEATLPRVFQDTVVLVPAARAVGERLELGASRPITPAEFENASVRVEPPGLWKARLHEQGLELVRLVDPITTSASIELDFQGGAVEAISVRPIRSIQ